MFDNKNHIDGEVYAVYYRAAGTTRMLREHPCGVTFAAACRAFQRLTRGPSVHTLSEVRIVCEIDDTTTVDWSEHEDGGYTTASILELRVYCAELAIPHPFGDVGAELTTVQRQNAVRCFNAFIDAMAKGV